MIWFFFAGFIAGMVATLMIGKHFADKKENENANRID